MKVTLGRRERRKLQTRAALESAALRLFAERGYEQTTVEDIAEAADVAVRTFFRYFSSKQHVLFGDVAHTIVGRLRAALAERPTGESPTEAVRAAMDAIEVADPDQQLEIIARLRLLERMPELLPAYLMVFQDMHVVLAEFVADRVGQGPADVYPQLVAGSATVAARTTMGVLQAHPERVSSWRSLRSIRHEAYDALTSGLDRLRP